MKRVLVSIYIDPEFYPPTKNAIFELANSTEEVIVLTRNLFKFDLIEYPENVRFVKVGRLMTVQESEKTSFFSKIWVFLLFWISYHRIVLWSKIDTAIFYDAIPLFTFLIGIKPSKVVYWYHNHDMPDVRFTRKYSIGWFSAKYEHIAMSKLDYFSLPSVDRLEYYPNWTKKESFFYIPNFPRFSTFANIDLRNRFVKFTIIFQGAIGEGHGIEDIIKILKKFSNVQLVLKGPVRENYKRKIEQLSLEERVAEQITWVGLTSYSELINLTSKCHLGIAIHQGSDEVSKTLGTASNKIYEYLACGLPLILHDSDQFRKNLSDEPFVFYYNGEIIKLEEILNDVSNNFNELSKKAREAFCSNYTFEAYFKPIIEQMNA